jgi:hypothetical protein
MVMDHIGGKKTSCTNHLKRWLDDLVNHSEVPQNGLLLVGPPSSGKTTFQLAASLLLPEDKVVVLR